MVGFLRAFYVHLVEPRSTDDDGRRQEFILNVLILGSLVLTLAALVIVLISGAVAVSDADRTRYALEVPYILLAAALFSGMIAISRRGHYVISAYALVALFLLLGTYILYAWGVLLPQGVLLFSLIIVMASVLLGTRFGTLVTLIASVCLVTLGALQGNHVLQFDASWMQTGGGVGDTLGFAVTLGVIATVSWLSNREIERSLSRARHSEAELKQERDSLEVKVQERTAELELAQREKIMELTKFAEFGRLTSSIIHELVTPLTTVALNLEQMHDEVHSERLKRALESTKRMERYVEAARKQLQHQSVLIDFSLSHEVRTVVDFLTPQAEKNQVQIDFMKLDDTQLFGNPIKFHQLVTNLIANAINAYEATAQPKRFRVAVELWQADTFVQLSVTDWGMGIPEKYLDKIFDPFFTLKKSDQGMGIGLSLCKEIVESEFGGTIEVVSNKTAGTVFTVKLPLHQKHHLEAESA